LGDLGVVAKIILKRMFKKGKMEHGLDLCEAGLEEMADFSE
jgi:hypothetical protein